MGKGCGARKKAEREGLPEGGRPGKQPCERQPRAPVTFNQLGAAGGCRKRSPGTGAATQRAPSLREGSAGMGLAIVAPPW